MARRPKVGQLRVRKLADRSGERVARVHPMTGERMLLNPANCDPHDLADVPNWQHEPWPLAGLVVEAKPKRCHLATDWVAQGIGEGWIEAEGGTPVIRPAGPRQDVWASSQTGTPHFFMHYDAIVLKAIDGDVRYQVVKQPDKYVDSDDPSQKVTPDVYATGGTRVDWFYDCELEA